VKKKKLILILCSILVVGLITFFGVAYFLNDYNGYSDKKACYLSTAGYAATLGIDQFSVEGFASVYGKPESTQRYRDSVNPNRELVLYSYPAFDVLYLVTSGLDGVERFMFLQVVVHSDEFQFGIIHIDVGSSRMLVRIAYLFEEKLSREDIEYESHDFPGAEEGFYGDQWWRVLFSYDSKGRVEKIAYTISPNCVLKEPTRFRLFKILSGIIGTFNRYTSSASTASKSFYPFFCTERSPSANAESC
jgi:hypothetical protein